MKTSKLADDQPDTMYQSGLGEIFLYKFYEIVYYAKRSLNNPSKINWKIIFVIKHFFSL